jgi:uncharacterized phage infection (PIP) family protein YhgE
MFTTVIETVQTAQKEAIKTFVKHEDIAKSLTNLVDAQAAFTVTTVKNTTEAANMIGQEIVKAGQNVVKYDFSKHITDAYDAFAQAFATTKAK